MKHSKLFVTLMALVIAFSAFFPASTAAAAPGGTYKCYLLSQSPKDYTAYNPRTDFDARFTLLNTGTAGWNGVDLVFLGGTRMHTKADRYDITKVVKPQGKVSVYIDMEAPKNPGTYVTYWGLMNGSQLMCRFYLIIRVK